MSHHRKHVVSAGRHYILAIAILLVAAAAYGQEDRLAIFDGVWVAVNPPGPRVIFTKVGLGQRTATLPIIGAASIRVSDGQDESELRVSGPGFDCYYSFSKISAREMVWHRKSGSDVCPQSTWFKREEAGEEAEVERLKRQAAEEGIERSILELKRAIPKLEKLEREQEDARRYFEKERELERQRRIER